MDDEHFMKKALEQARMALAAGEFPVGCVMVLGKDIIATGIREGTGGSGLNEVDHAEIMALRNLSRLDHKVNMQEVTVFSTLEPCLMCFGALLISGIGRIVLPMRTQWVEAPVAIVPTCPLYIGKARLKSNPVYYEMTALNY